MGNPLRDKNPDAFRLITTRTDGARLWMIPSNNLNKIIGGVLARYQEIFHIELYAYAFLSNHYHLVLRAPESNCDEFMENTNRELARRINWKNHRTGTLWGRRYSDQTILTEDDLLEAFLYVSTNAVKHGLVEHQAEWPGLQSFEQSITEQQRSFSFMHYSGKDGPTATRHKLILTPIPQFIDLKKEARSKELRSKLEERMKELRQQRKARCEGFLGADRVRFQEPGSVPQTVSRSARPHCYTKSYQLLKEFRKAERYRRELYTEASISFRLGELNTHFPPNTFKPPLHRLPRYAPFIPMKPYQITKS